MILNIFIGFIIGVSTCWFFTRNGPRFQATTAQINSYDNLLQEANRFAIKEPIIHSHITDALQDGHALAHSNVNCDRCGELVHAFNNECMQTWVEAGRGNYCLTCFDNFGGCLRSDLATTTRS